MAARKRNIAGMTVPTLEMAIGVIFNLLAFTR
jgi:hypothetical protein